MLLPLVHGRQFRPLFLYTCSPGILLTIFGRRLQIPSYRPGWSTPYRLYGVESSWDVESHAASRNISRLLYNPKVHYRVHNIPPLIPILNQKNPVHTLTSHFLNIHSNIILSSTPRSSECLLPSCLPTETSSIYHLPTCATRPAHHILLDLIAPGPHVTGDRIEN